jgi:hypothetical protein
MSSRNFKPHHKPGEEMDAYYWNKAVFQTRIPRDGGRFDRYRWALHYEQLARKRHGCNVNLKDVLAELVSGWEKYGGPDDLTLAEATDAITNSWHRSDELTADAIANHQGFKSPPTFAEKGTLVPRNVDEANT